MRKETCLGRLAFAALLVLLLTTLLSLSAPAQIQNGQITGQITDPSGAAIPSAKVQLTNLGTSITTALTSNASGLYNAVQLPVGQYKVVISAPGFKQAAQTGITVNAGAITHLDFKLQVGANSELVEVTGAPPQVDTESAKLGETVESRQVANLPLNGRNVYDLMQLTSGAVNVLGVLTENGHNTVVNGLREDFNGFLVNGVSNKGLSGGVVNTPIEDTVQEFQQLTLNMSAQYGNSAGSISNLVTKSGTNNFHGSAWEYLRNDKLDAENFFLKQDGAKKPPLHFNQFGGTLGGPIKKDKIFFYGSYQGDRFNTSAPPATVTVESPEWRQAVIAANPGSVAALLYKSFTPSIQGTPGQTLADYLAGGNGTFGSDIATYLCPDNYLTAGAAQKVANILGVTAQDQAALAAAKCSTIPGLQAGTFNRNAPFMFNTVALFNQQKDGTGNLFNGNEASLRLDLNLSQKDRLFTQMNWLKNTDKFGPGLTDSARGFTNPVKNVLPNFQLSEVHSFSPTVVNEFRAGYTGNISLVNTNLPGVPEIEFDDGMMGFGSYNGYPQFFKENIYTYGDMLSVSKGKHSFKFGADIRRNIENSEFNVGRPSYYFFDHLFFAADSPYSQASGVDPGIISGTPAHLQSNVRHWRNWEYGFYFNDDWKATSRLTLTFGLRYDLFTRHTEENGQVTQFIFGPGSQPIDNITTGAGTIHDANAPRRGPGCNTAAQIATAQLAGVCGPGGFAKASSLGSGDHNNFGPRFGFAWDVLGNGRTSVRGGIGVSYESTLYNPLSNSRWNLPFYSFNSATNALNGDVNTVVYGPQTPGAAPSFTGPPDPNNHQGTQGATAVGNIMGWDPNNPNLAQLTGIVPRAIRDPYVYNYFLGIQREVLPNTVLELNYVGTTGHKLFRAQNTNRIPGGRLPAGTCVTDNLGRKLCSQISALNAVGRLNPNYGTLRTWENVANSNYNSLQASLRRRMARDLTFSLNYTWSHAIDNGSTWHSGATSSNGAAAGEGYTTDPILNNLDRGNSIFDIRHRIVGNFVWEMPFYRSQTGLIGHILGGWQWNGIVAFQTGAHWEPWSAKSRSLKALVPGACSSATFDPTNCVNVGGDFNLDGVANDRPNAIANTFEPGHNGWANGWTLPTGFFSAPCLGCIGNLGRNTFVGPSYTDFDLSLFKKFKVSERVNMEFRAESFNVLNHTNFMLPGAQGATHNRITDASFGKAGAAFNPRNLQFGLKLLF